MQYNNVVTETVKPRIICIGVAETDVFRKTRMTLGNNPWHLFPGLSDMWSDTMTSASRVLF